MSLWVYMDFEFWHDKFVPLFYFIDNLIDIMKDGEFEFWKSLMDTPGNWVTKFLMSHYCDLESLYHCS